VARVVNTEIKTERPNRFQMRPDQSFSRSFAVNVIVRKKIFAVKPGDSACQNLFCFFGKMDAPDRRFSFASGDL
jgi:hypothetical protein